MPLLKYTYYIHYPPNVLKQKARKVIAHYDTLGFCQYLWYGVDLKAFEKSTISNAPISSEIWCSGNKINALRSSEFCNVKSPTLLGQILTLKKQPLGGDKNCGPTFGLFCVISVLGGPDYIVRLMIFKVWMFSSISMMKLRTFSWEKMRSFGYLPNCLSPLPNLYRDTSFKKQCYKIELGMFENISLPSLIH